MGGDWCLILCVWSGECVFISVHICADFVCLGVAFLHHF